MVLLFNINSFFRVSGGQTGIRTLETVPRLHAFQACAFDHSATCPWGVYIPATTDRSSAKSLGNRSFIILKNLSDNLSDFIDIFEGDFALIIRDFYALFLENSGYLEVDIGLHAHHIIDVSQEDAQFEI